MFIHSKPTLQFPSTAGHPATARRLLFPALLCACLALSHTAQGVRPTPDGDFGNGNTGEGTGALFSLTSGIDNTAVGFNALYSTTSNSFNTGTGFSALGLSNVGNYNTGDGCQVLNSNTTGTGNTGVGADAFLMNTTGNYNTALGYYAGSNLTTGSYNIDIGNAGVAGESAIIRIGTAANQNATFIAGISGTTVAAGTTVVIDSNGQLGTIVSSQKFKDNVKPMDNASEAILALKPVTFRYKHELDPKGIPQFGLIAEEVEKVNPDLVARDGAGKVYTVRYEAVNAMLLNEFLKEHSKVQELETKVAQLKSAMAQEQKNLRTTADQQQQQIKALATTLKAQALEIQKVSARSEVTRPAAQLVNNTP